MTRQVRFRPAAQRDRERLVEFLAAAPPAVSEEMVRRIERRIDQLARHPFLGRSIAHGLRETIVAYGKSRYVIRYQVTDDWIMVVRLWHGREDRPR